MLRAMFSGRMEVLTDAEGWILIDRCGKHFGSILNFLRDEDVPLPDRSGSSHVFTIPESTNFFHEIFFVHLSTRYNFCIEIKLSMERNANLTVYFSRKRHFAAFKRKFREKIS